jgi:purine-binding chemotaxis protein CheW
VETLSRAVAEELRAGEHQDWLLCRQHGCYVALRADQIVETMRPLATESVPEMPPFVLGLAIVRGAAVPVVDVGTLLGRKGAKVTRWVTVPLGERCVALAVESIEGVRRLPSNTFEAVPPLLRGAADNVVAAVRALDRELLVALEAGRLFTEDEWRALTTPDRDP